MAHGQPDHGSYSAKKTVASMADNAELAARLGSIVTFDRRGDVVLLDDFEDNIEKWWIALSRAGAAIVLSNDTARNGGSSCKITTGDTIGDEEQMSRYLSYPALSKMGLEISISLHSFVSPIRMLLHLDDGVTWTAGALQYYPNTDTLEYLGTDGLYHIITTTLALYLARNCFHNFKLVVDPVSGHYVRAIIGAHTYDLSAHLLYTGLFPVHNFLGISFYTTARAAAHDNIYVDDVIVTQNEP